MQVCDAYNHHYYHQATTVQCNYLGCAIPLANSVLFCSQDILRVLPNLFEYLIKLLLVLNFETNRGMLVNEAIVH